MWFKSRLTIPAVAAIGFCLVGGTTPAHADLGDQLFKLLADDGAFDDRFGRSVAISGTTAVVGARNHDDNGNNSGSAYLFDTATGEQLFKLLSNDGALSDSFGVSVAISGSIALVGATGDDDNGFSSGSVYIFDTTTGQQIAKFLPKDGAEGDGFGVTIAISGTSGNEIAIIGATGNDDNGNSSGSAYLFDLSDPANPVQTFKLLPIDGAAEDFFSFSVAISGDIAIVGAPSDDDNGIFSGSAYLFDTTTGMQITKLLPNQGEAFDRFGASVAINGTTAVIGALGENGNSGSAYIFDTTTGKQIATLLPSDLEADDFFGVSVAMSDITTIVGSEEHGHFDPFSGSAYLFNTASGEQFSELLPSDLAEEDLYGISVAISGFTTIVGAPWHDDNGSDSGAAYLFSSDTDSDGDGLFDSWETLGIPYIDSDGIAQLYLLDIDQDGISDADPLHKDLFVEIDAMDGPNIAPTMMDLQLVVDAFAGAPVENPGKNDGITLHLQFSDSNIPTVDFPNQWVEFDVVKQMWFGTTTEQGNVEVLQAKFKAYRYCVFGNTYNGIKSGGSAEVGGNDFMVTMGAYRTPGGDADDKAALFMHELGHALGLKHYGPQSQATPAELADRSKFNYNPNHYSIMNYHWTRWKKWMTPGSWPLAVSNIGYSSAALNTLDESDLDELAGLVPAEHALTFPAPGFVVPFNIETDPKLEVITVHAVIAHESTVDWNNNGNPDPHDPDNPIARDLNRIEEISPGTTLTGYEEWPFLLYDFKDSEFYDDGVHPLEGDDVELTPELHEILDALLPPVCIGDITIDGTVGVADLLELFAAWGPCTVGIACVQDLDENGVVSVVDLLELFANWGPCP